jgi:aminoglycoside phosphotransferase family enzyme/predicted kinase
VETHSAWIFLIGDRAYKLKKPVNLGFLDFSTREAREAALHREVELNRRLSPDVYLGVADVVGPDGVVCDHLLMMRRMPEDRRLSTLVRAGEPLDDEILAIARALATFHARAATSTEIAAVGSAEAIRSKLELDLEQLAGVASSRLDRARLDAVARLARRFVAGRHPLFEARRAAGLVRDGHGDLLADDMFCLEDGPRILDCIEFDDRLRHGDVLADVAFLAMDLERLGAPALAVRFVESYQALSAERHPGSLIDYYVASRALIRSKVASIRATQGRPEAEPEAARLLELAEAHLRHGRVRLVLVGGGPGTGKSTIAAGLSDRMGWVLLRSDEVRKDVSGLAHDARAGAPIGRGLYDQATTAATYTALLARARAALEHGESVVLDATWMREARRLEARRLAEATSSELVELRCEAPLGLAVERIRVRAGGADPSDATPDVAASVAASFEPWSTARAIATTGSIDEAIEAAIATADAV